MKLFTKSDQRIIASKAFYFDNRNRVRDDLYARFNQIRALSALNFILSRTYT